MSSYKPNTDARAGRGSGNGGNEAWYNSPFWSNVASKEPAESIPASTKAAESVVQSEEDSLRARQRKAFSFAY